MSKKPQQNVEQATMIITQIIDVRHDQVSISPSWVATEAMVKLGAKMLLRRLLGIYQLAHLQCRQIARQQLRRLYEPENDAEKAQHELFPNLQARYPAAPTPGRDEPAYVKLESLNVHDWQFNIDRMEADVRSRYAHLDAFKAWGRSRFQEGAETAGLAA